MNKLFYVYIIASTSNNAIYTGMTNNIEQRVREHKMGLIPGFTQKYRCNKLIYYEVTEYVRNAILREKQIKGWRREKKVNLINSKNPEWKDLAISWMPEEAKVSRY